MSHGYGQKHFGLGINCRSMLGKSFMSRTQKKNIKYYYLKKTQFGWFAKALSIMDSQSLVYIAARNNCIHGQQNIRRLKRHKSYNIKRFSHLPYRIVVKTNSRYSWFITRVKASPNDIPNLKKQILELFS